MLPEPRHVEGDKVGLVLHLLRAEKGAVRQGE